MHEREDYSGDEEGTLRSGLEENFPLLQFDLKISPKKEGSWFRLGFFLVCENSSERREETKGVRASRVDWHRDWVNFESFLESMLTMVTSLNHLLESSQCPTFAWMDVLETKDTMLLRRMISSRSPLVIVVFGRMHLTKYRCPRTFLCTKNIIVASASVCVTKSVIPNSIRINLEAIAEELTKVVIVGECHKLANVPDLVVSLSMCKKVAQESYVPNAWPVYQGIQRQQEKVSSKLGGKTQHDRQLDDPITALTSLHTTHAPCIIQCVAIVSLLNIAKISSAHANHTSPHLA
ncbi:hypothetical protein VNO77_08507 [Canavalia gladiata]|uniref:Uncharacterized protein n=1 Tax=Canavalia gladiata TaxID=3824 RepID=A0AAN9M9A2_CANGL